MATTNVLTHQMIAREAAKMFVEEAPFISNINKGRQEEFGAVNQGFKKGDSVRIKIPPVPTVYTGAVFAEGGTPDDFGEKEVTLTVDTQKHTGIQFGSAQKKLDLSDFKERYLRPAIQTLSSVVEADLLQRAYAGVPNLVGTPGSVPTQMKVYGQARSKLQHYLAPSSDRSVVFSSDANLELVDSSKALFHAKKEIDRGFLRGSIGEAQGADFYEHQSCPIHTNGTKVAGVTVSGAGQSGGSLLLGGLTAADTITKGSVFTIAGVFATHPLTGLPYAHLQQFVVRENFTAAGTTGTIQIYPEIKATMPNKTVSALPANAAALTFVGAASTAYRQDLMFHRDAFTTAMVPLDVLPGCEGYTARLPNGFSVRVMTGGDFTNDKEATRIDVLYGFSVVRGIHASRITE
ncbi:P22 phage major capsid protein family protein [Achromobacter marplatensis]|uniref:P22 phage major capsid protein family protein n=1 Tax=Achromobacter marplatensis TaxID=470868 RepID=UPI0028E37BCF|nr:P22 phage major capsid protein family protein [Achromobacter marplatensis]